MSKIPEGSVERYTLHVKLSGGATLKASKWTLKVKAWREITIEKADAIEMADDLYDFYVDTAKTGRGELRAHLLIDTPDSDYKGGLRPQIILLPLIGVDGRPDIVI